MIRIINRNKGLAIGPFIFPDRKKPIVGVMKDNQVKVYGHFISADAAEEFMRELAEAITAEKEEKEGRKK